MSEAQSGVACDRACAMQNLRDAIGGHAELSRQFRRAHIERFQFLGQVFTRINHSDGHSGPPSDSRQSPRAMAPRRPARPFEANSPLIVDANGVLALAVTE